MRLPRVRGVQWPRFDAFQTWVTLVVAAVVALGLLGDTYQRYLQDSGQLRLSLHGLDREHWGNYVATYIDADPPPDLHTKVASLEEIDSYLNRAADEGTDVVALRKWTGVLTNPTTGATFTLGIDLGMLNLAVAGFGFDEDDLGHIVDGHAPRPGEIALSRSTARALGVGLGDTVVASDPRTSSTLPLTVGGIVRDTAVWTLGDSLYLFAESDSYSALVNWDDSARLSHALRPMAGVIFTETYWNGQSESLAEYPGPPGEHTSDEEGERWYPGPREFVQSAWTMAVLAGLAALVLGSRPRRRPLTWATPARTMSAAVVGTAAGAVAAILLSALTYVALPAVVPDLVQPGFGLFSLANVAWWLGFAAALALALEAVARLRGARLWERRPFAAVARLLGRARRIVPWLAVAGAAAAIAAIVRANLDRSMLGDHADPPNSVLVPVVVGLGVLLIIVASTVGRAVSRTIAPSHDGTPLPRLASAYALIAVLVIPAALAVGNGAAFDAAQQYDTSSADIAAQLGLEDDGFADFGSELAYLSRTIDTGAVAGYALAIAFAAAAALVLVGLANRAHGWRTQVTGAAGMLAVTVGAFVVVSVGAALLETPLAVHDVSTFLGGLQPGHWTLDGVLDVALRIVDATVWVAVSTAIALALVVAATSAVGKVRSRLT